MLDVMCGAIDDRVFAAWGARAELAGVRLGWGGRQTVVRRHAAGASLALAAPCDALFLATEVNEWALCASLVENDRTRWRGLEHALAAQALADAEEPAALLPPVLEDFAALMRFERLAALEVSPRLRALVDTAASRGLTHVLDDSELTLGTGAGGRSFPRNSLPAVADIRWNALRNIPTALVTGSNGKTTTVRLVAACARAVGRRAGYNCTDGVFLNDEVLTLGDYSGPAGARQVLRDPRTDTAILETARGGILRRGIAVSHADTAVVTNVSADHFGEYGIDDLAGLADVKLSVAAVVPPDGLLVLNADDPLLRAQAGELVRRFGRCPPLGWFALDADHPALRDSRLRGESTCGVRSGRMWLTHRGAEHDLGLVAAMPLSVGGIAAYNLGNLAGAALAALTLGIPPDRIAAVFARFGDDPGDNPGRMMRFAVGGAAVLVDYAHNPDGLRGLLTVADHLRGSHGRLALLLGHAGNRKDEDIEELARAAAQFRPDLVVVKENETQLRGRAPGEVPRIIRSELLRLGLTESALALRDTEFEAARFAVEWARPGDVLALPIHSQSARAAVMAMLAQRRPVN